MAKFCQIWSHWNSPLANLINAHNLKADSHDMRLTHVDAAEVCIAAKIRKSSILRTAPVCRTRMHQTHVMWISLHYEIENLTYDADRFPDEPQSAHDADVLGSAAGGPEPDQVLHAEESHQTNFLEKEWSKYIRPPYLINQISGKMRPVANLLKPQRS